MKQSSTVALLVALFLVDVATAMPQGGPTPAGRYGHCMAYDTQRQVVVMFGGNGSSVWSANLLSETWEWDGANWTQRVSANAPSPRAHGAMCYDAARGVCVYFGGNVGGQSELAETWEWDGVNWTQRILPSAPPARYSPNMVYDSAREVAVLFGGWDGGSGFGDTWEYDGVTWTQVATTGPAPRGTHSMAFDAARGKTVIFGGWDGSTRFGDTWEWDGTSWTQATPPTAPSARDTQGMCFDPVSSRVVLFGGNAPGPLGDTWEWDGGNWVAASPMVSPTPRLWAMGQMAFDAARGEVVLFGGLVSSEVLSDTWKFKAGEWRPALDYQVSPINGHRYALTPSMPWLDGEAVAVLEGGHLATIRDDQENAWLWQTFGDEVWFGLNDTALEGTFVWASGEPLAYENWHDGEPNDVGGEDAVNFKGGTGGAWNDGSEDVPLPCIIEVRGGPVAEVEAAVAVTVPALSGIRGHGLSALAGGGAVLFGGETSSGPHFPTYELHDADWQKQYSLINPMVRTQHTLLLDPVRQNNLLFGGENPVGTKLNDTWTYAGGQWSYVMPAAAPSPRSGHRMAFDEVSGVGLLFGGEDALGNALADFWSWNGSAWTQLTPPVLPPARHRHGMAFDALRDRVVLYGGIDGATRLDDVWEWNGSAWSQVVPVPGQGGSWTPQPRDGFSMAYDRTSERVVLHGGETDAGCQDDFWSWDGLGWTLHSPTGDASPTARADAQLIYDSQGGRLLLFAGGCGASLDAELWQVDLPVTASATVYGTGCGSPPLGFVPDAAGRPLLGEVATATIVDAPTLVAGVAMGWSNTFAFPVPLPFDLTSIGMPGCDLWQSTNVFGLGASPLSATTLRFAYDIPNQPTLMGVYVYIQAYCFAPGANPLQIIISNGIEWRLGGV